MRHFISLLLIVAIIFISNTVIGQSKASVIAYFDSDWNVTLDTANASFYRTVKKTGGKYDVKDFYKSTRVLQMEAMCSRVEPKLIFDGQARWYYENGKTKETVLYHNNKPEGLYNCYYENGQPKSELFFKGDTIAVHQQWSEQGEPMLKNGTGLFTAQSYRLPFSSYTEVVDSLPIASYSVSDDRMDTVYTFCEKSVEYEGGFPDLYNGIGKALKGKYPKEARRSGIEGKVFIQFVVNEQGALQNVKVIRGIGGGCDEVAIAAFTNQKKWIPARHKNRPVKATMVLPIVFRLN